MHFVKCFGERVQYTGFVEVGVFVFLFRVVYCLFWGIIVYSGKEVVQGGVVFCCGFIFRIIKCSEVGLVLVKCLLRSIYNCFEDFDFCCNVGFGKNLFYVTGYFGWVFQLIQRLFFLLDIFFIVFGVGYWGFLI